MLSQIRLGTRGSPLALKQAEHVKTLLQSHHPDLLIDTVTITTKGDTDKTTPLYQLGGKGIFIKELEAALLRHEIDIAVHSLKDVTSRLDNGLCLAGFLKAESVHDVLVLREGLSSLEDLKSNSRIATGSMRRKALVKRWRPDIEVVDIRGNVETRLRKLEEDAIQGVILSEAGLIRLHLEHRVSYRFDPWRFYPAPGQGVITLEIREEDAFSRRMCQLMTDSFQEKLSRTQLAFLEKVGFDCRVPLGFHIECVGDQIKMGVFVSDTHFQHVFEEQLTCFPDDAENQARELGERCQKRFK